MTAGMDYEIVVDREAANSDGTGRAYVELGVANGDTMARLWLEGVELDDDDEISNLYAGPLAMYLGYDELTDLIELLTAARDTVAKNTTTEA